jgi:hypothetical protein
MAPNVITLLGLTASFIGFGLLCVFCPGFTSEGSPPWVLPAVGAGLFIYQTLDNMDGKVSLMHNIDMLQFSITYGSKIRQRVKH